MPTIYTGDTKYAQYALDASAHTATHFNSLEKVCKISYRVLDIAVLLFQEKVSSSFKLLSSQIKDVILVLETSRFFPVAYPMIFPDENGKRFYDVKTKIQTAERASITAHLVFKVTGGLERVGLINLGKISTYTLGRLTVFRWLAEAFILSFNFFGSLDGTVTYKANAEKLTLCEKKIAKWNSRAQSTDFDQKRVDTKLRKWEKVQEALNYEQNKAWLKVAAMASKFALIVFAVSVAALYSQAIFACDMTILTMGIISDGFGLANIFYTEYCAPRLK